MLQEWGKAHGGLRPHSLGSGAQGSWAQDRGSARSRKCPMVCQGWDVTEPHGQGSTGTLLHHGPGGRAFQHPLYCLMCLSWRSPILAGLGGGCLEGDDAFCKDLKVSKSGFDSNWTQIQYFEILLVGEFEG